MTRSSVRHVGPVLAIIFALQFVPWSRAGEGRGSVVGIQIVEQGVQPYPPEMTLAGIYSGEAHAVISVDADGRLADCLVTAYTNPAFGASALNAIKKWKYIPAEVEGRACAARASLVFNFRDNSVSIQALPGALVRRAFFRTMDEHFVHRPYQLRELDKIPEPLTVVQPAISAPRLTREITVEFYIDEAGQVRMPTVPVELATDAYAAAAVAAVEKWKFEPPLWHGRPVMVLAQQVFTFRSAVSR